MDTKHMQKKKILIGFDLTDSYAQISYLFPEQNHPETMKVLPTEQYNIPVCLCKKQGVNQWYYGQQAQKSAKEGKGELLTNLYSLALESDTLTVDGQVIQTGEILLLFVKKCLGMLNILLEGSEVECLMITVERLTEKAAQVMKFLIRELPFDSERIHVQTHEESLFFYMLYILTI